MKTSLELDTAVYSLEAVQKAAYRFIDRLTVVIRQRSGLLVCEVALVEGIGTPLEVVLADFKREMLDQQLRVQIKKETESVRNLILSYAFSRTGLQQ